MTNWIGEFIAADDDFDGAPLLRHEAALDQGHGAITAATMRVTALGVIEAFIDGVPVSDDVLTPGWSSFEWRLRYAEYDVTALVALPDRSSIVVGAALGNGWYRGRLGWDERAPYGDELGALIDLVITFEDGHVQSIGTDPTWKAGPSTVTSNSLYDGQHVDARLTQPGWNRAGFDDADWVGTHVTEYDKARLEPYVGPPVRRQQTLQPVEVWTSPGGKVLVDFGQNLVGWVRVAVRGTAGQPIALRHAEVLEHGELGTRPLRTALATDRYTLSGESDRFEPTFTFHGFRYVEVEGWPGGIEAIDQESLTAVVVSSDLRPLGTFECSDPLLNQLHQNVVWGMRGNFLDVPTDCPQRDERLGWTGDIAAFAPTAAYLFDVNHFLRDWLRDLALEQSHQDGIVPFVVPDILKDAGIPEAFSPLDSTAIWSDAAAWVPWATWVAYGDREALSEAFPAMLSHGRRVQSLLSARGVWEDGFQFGDWLDPDAPPDHADRAKADPAVVATASAYRTARIIAETAEILGDDAVMAEFTDAAERLRHAFRAAYIEGERIRSDCTTVYSLAIVFGLLDENEKRWAGRRLADLVVASGHHISTGFAGTPFIMDALTSTGHVETAYTLLLQRECPSWLYPVTVGATTIWERWDSMLPDGTINPGSMTSFNHYALGAVADWMHRVLGGLAPLDPGYARILIAPQPGGDIEWAKTSLATPRGLAEVAWEREGDAILLEATVPDGATAVVRIAGSGDVVLEAGSHQLTLNSSAAADFESGSGIASR